MVNLNPNRNLTPDSTPWGRAVEKRLNDLERENGLRASESRVTEKGLNSLSKSVFGRSLGVTYQGDTQYFDFPTGTTQESFVLDPLIEGSTRTGNILISGSIPLRMYNIRPVGSASMTETLSWRIGTEEYRIRGSSQGGQLVLIPESSSVYHEIGQSLPFAFRMQEIPNDYSFRLTLTLTMPQNLTRCDIRIPDDWSIVTQQA